MSQNRIAIANSLIRWLKIIWAFSIVTIATTIGAYIGWQSHGLVGAIALGFVGLVIGGVLSSPSVLLQILS